MAPFTDHGPGDYGSALELRLGPIAYNRSLTFQQFYGVASTETEAIAAVKAVGATAWVFAQRTTGGTPTTFIYAYRR